MNRGFVLATAMLAVATMAGAAVAGEYRLVIGETSLMVAGHTRQAVAINGQIPGPLLHFREGEDAVIHVTNALSVASSIHWHGMRVPAAMDGVPGLNDFTGIGPGKTFDYRFRIGQNGTYWYHAHSGFQEQEGLYGPIVIDAKEGDPFRYDRDYVVMLSDFPGEAPERILANLKADSDYYDRARRTVPDFIRDAFQDGLSGAVADRLAWGRMRMSPTDLSDVSGYTFLVNGKSASANETFLFKPGERVRLRFINAASMTYFDARIPGLKLTVVAADGQNVDPVPVDEFRIAPAEVFDVIVQPRDDTAFTIFAQSLDRSGYARATLAPRDRMSAPVPLLRPRAILTQADMGMTDMHMATSTSGATHGDDMADMDMSPPMTGMDMGEQKSEIGKPPRGWAGGYPAGEKVLRYADLRALTPDSDTRPPDREIVLHLTGNMERYIWTLNGKPYGDGAPIRLHYGERVKITFVNDTMMAHPMHLHGMFLELLNGQPDGWWPKKHIVSVAPGQSVSTLLTADAPGEWAFHCHLLYHMASGMMTTLVVDKKS